MSVVSLDTLQTLRATWRCDGLRLVLTNGVFDLLHSGHVRYLEQARALGDLLVIGINSDASARAVKGSLRPLVSEENRAYLLAALRWVDYVTIFPEFTAEVLVETLQPEVYVKGGDYGRTEQNAQVIDTMRLPEARVVQAYGGQVVLLPYLSGHSTTALIGRIVARFGHMDEHE
jgi:D-glycero-beta-D-manno-heptose 1-phosphate adenylyltransferase